MAVFAHSVTVARNIAIINNLIMTFKIGDRVVHPQHGVGQVVKQEDREFEPGVVRGYYEITIPGGSTLWAPVDLKTSGLRKLAKRSEIANCRKILESRPSPLMADARLRQADLADRLKLGTSVTCMRMASINHCTGRSQTFSVLHRLCSARNGLL